MVEKNSTWEFLITFCDIFLIEEFMFCKLLKYCCPM
jgi:hypothetical protein